MSSKGNGMALTLAQFISLCEDIGLLLLNGVGIPPLLNLVVVLAILASMNSKVSPLPIRCGDIADNCVQVHWIGQLLLSSLPLGQLIQQEKIFCL